MLRVIHVSDIHIRNLKYHEDYRRVFSALNEKLVELKPDLVVNTGDSAHTKTQISPEFVQLCSEHIRDVASIAPYHIILGNHDLNLVNLDRQDAISPIVENLRGSTVHPIYLHKKSGPVPAGYGATFWVFSCADDRDQYPKKSDWSQYKKDINIGLFHGAVRSSYTDTGWEMNDEQDTISIFDGLDYVMMGDIHKRQFLDVDGRIAYAGSLIQQNFGEDTEKGFLVWDIESKDDFQVKFVELEGSKKFYTLRLDEDLRVPEKEIRTGSHVRILTPRSLTLAEQKRIESEVRRKFSPHDIITAPDSSTSKEGLKKKQRPLKMSDTRDLGFQEKMIRDFFSTSKVSSEVMDEIIMLNRKFQMDIEKEEEVSRGVFWKVNSLAWNNMFNYGEQNILDFSKITGITGIFAPNSAGKSSLINILLEALFDKTTSGISKNIHLINDNKSSAHMLVEFDVGDEKFGIERTIERIEYNKKKADVKEWGKTSLNFFQKMDDDVLLNLNGELRPETEKSIRKRIGRYEDFVLTSLLAQSRDDDILKCKETERRKILYRFLDLDIFEAKEKLAKDEGREFFQELKDFSEEKLERAVSVFRSNVEKLTKQIEQCNFFVEDLKKEKEEYEVSLSFLRSSREMVEDVEESPEDLKEDWETVANRWEIVHIGAMQKEEELRLLESQLLDEVPVLPDWDPAEHFTVKKELEKLWRDLASLEASVVREKRDMKLLEKVPCDNKFPSCQFLVDANKAKDRLPDTMESVVTLKSKISQKQKKLKELDEIQEEWSEKHRLEQEDASKRLRIEHIKNDRQVSQMALIAFFREALEIDSKILRLSEMKDRIKKNEQIEKEIKKMAALVQGFDKKLEESYRKLNDISRELGSNETNLSNLLRESARIAKIKVKCEAYERYIEAMGKHGIAHRILVEKLPLINEEINKILSSVADFSVLIEHDEEEQSIRLYLQYGDYRSRLLELAGGAEKMLASIAIRAALLSMTNLPKTNMFIIDEGFGSLDIKNLDNIQMMFNYLKTIFDHVLIISHIDQLKDMVDNSIEISSDDERYSHIEIC